MSGTKYRPVYYCRLTFIWQGGVNPIGLSEFCEKWRQGLTDAKAALSLERGLALQCV